jgi:hypothetical protein
MPKVKVEHLKVGMVVSADVKNMDDMLLLPAKCLLTEKHIEILQAWGIPEVMIEGAGDIANTADLLARIPPEQLARLTEETRALFWEYDENQPFHAALLNLILRRRVRKGLHA